MILDLHSFKSWDEYPYEHFLGANEIVLGNPEDGSEHGYCEQIIEAPTTEPCYVCGKHTHWWSMSWQGMRFCQPLCYRAWDFYVYLDLAPWHEGAD